MNRLELIAQAQRKGFQVIPDPDEAGWFLVSCPAKPRLPAHTQGSCATRERAWMLACCLALEWPD